MGRFLTKAVIFAASLWTLLLVCESLVLSMAPWRQYEDPRARILWDGAFDGSTIVLLGGSEFASLYVDSLSETLWARLEASTGERVFPGALNAARPPDVVAGAVLISRQWPADTIVFVGVPPTRFVVSRVHEPPHGNFAEAYFRRYGIDEMHDGALRRFQGQVYRSVLRPFFATRVRNALVGLVEGPGAAAWMRNRVWSNEGEAARELFEFFESNLVMGAGPGSFAWMEEVTRRLEGAGIQPVFVLTPLNEALVQRFARVHAPDAILRHLRALVDAAQKHLERAQSPVIDLTDGFPSKCFFDLLHLNTCGDDLMATRLADWLHQHRRSTPDDQRR